MLTTFATAHVGDIVAGIDVVPPHEGETLPPIEANYGLLLPTSEAGYEWVCHEAVTEPGAITAPRYVRNGGAVWLATLSSLEQGRGGATLFRSPDGCAWNDVTGIPTGVRIRAATFDPASDGIAWAVSDTPDEANTVYGSTDGGQTWSAAFPAVEDRLFHTVGADWATATNHAGTEAWFWRRDGDGAWSEQPVAVPKGTEEARFGVLDAAGDELWAVIDPLGDDTLVRSTDGGATFETVSTTLGLFSDGAIVDGSLWAVRGFGFENVIVAPDGTTTPFPDGALPSFGIAGQDGQAYLAVLSYLHGALVQQGPTAGPLSIAAYPDNVLGPPSCPAGTEVADICVPLWSTLEPELRGFDGTGPSGTGDTGLTNIDATDASGSCGCQPTPGGPVWGVALVVALAWRRRR